MLLTRPALVCINSNYPIYLICNQPTRKNLENNKRTSNGCLADKKRKEKKSYIITRVKVFVKICNIASSV